MGSEDRKRMSVVSEGHGRFSRLLALAILVALLATIPSVSFTAAASSNSDTKIEVTAAEDGIKVNAAEVDVPDYMTSLDRPKEKYQISERKAMTATPVGGQQFTSPHLSEALMQMREGSANPSPQGSPDPRPLDAPFQDPDILVYNDAVNSQQNVSLANTSNGDIYVSYDHDPGTGLKDVYVSKSTDGGTSWNQRAIATDAGEHEYCPSIAATYVPSAGTDLLTVWYNAPELEFAWSIDGDTWTIEDFGGGGTFWEYVNCPYVDMMGDFIVVVAESYNTGANIDTWRILYTVDGANWFGYYFNMWAGAWVYQPRVSIQSFDEVANVGEIVVTMTIHDRSDPNPANWFYEGVMSDATPINTGDPNDDNWGVFYYMSGVHNQDPTGPAIEANDREVIFAMEIYNPVELPLPTHFFWCLFAFDVDDIGSASWDFCAGTGFLAFDPWGVQDVRYPMFWRDSTAVHAVWMNATDINYSYSPDGGRTFEGNPTTGGYPYKVTAPGVGTVMDAWHSPDIIVAGGKPCVAWHDTRGSNSIYFNTFGNLALFTIDTQPRDPNLWVREFGDSVKWNAPHSYLWMIGSNHDVEAPGSYENFENTRFTFSHWDDGSLTNVTTITVGGDNDIVAIYDVEHWLKMTNPGGTTTPTSGYQAAGSLVTIEAFAPAPPEGGQWLWNGWTGIGDGSYSGQLNPCVDCVQMNGPIEQIANWQLQWQVTLHAIPSGVGLELELDGVAYSAPYTTWFNDSEVHSINAPSPQGAQPLRHVFGSWNDGLPQMHNVFVSSEWTNFTATFNPEYWITIDTNPAGLTISVNSVDYIAPYSFWCLDGNTPWIGPNSPQYTGVLGERYMWKDWSDGGPPSRPYLCTGPATLIANYTLQHAVNITTTPADFNVIVGGQTVTTPQQYWWNDTTAHVLEAPQSVPAGSNSRFNFTDWSDGGARIHTYWANTSDDTVTANYKFQYKVTLQANYPGLSAKLDGTAYALPYIYWCNENTQHILEADTIQQFGHTRYVYDSWSDGGNQMHMITCDNTLTLQVNYDPEYKVFVNSTLIGVGAGTFSVIVGGSTVSTPYEVWWAADTTMSLDTDEFQPVLDPAAGIRYRFVDWDSSIMKGWTAVIDAPGLEFVVNFITQYKLTFVDDHGTPEPTPDLYPVTDGYYFDEGSSVSIETDDVVVDTTSHRWQFNGWTSGDLGGYTGMDNPATIAAMVGPITQTVSWVDQYLLKIVSDHEANVTGEAEEQSATEFWFDSGTQATFEVDDEVFTSPPAEDARDVFGGWSSSDAGGYTGMDNPAVITMNGPVTQTAAWVRQYLLTINSEYGTPDVTGEAEEQSSTEYWFVAGTQATFSVEAEVFISILEDSKAVFDGWTGGTSPATMNAPLTVTATWHIEHYLTIYSVYITDITTTLGSPTGEGWYEEGAIATISVEKSEEKGDYIYKFKSWTDGDVADPKSATTTTTMDSAKTLVVEWSREAKFSVMDLWWVFVIIIIIVVVLIAVLLLKRKKPVEEEILPPEEEEILPEEPPAPPE